MKVFIIRHGDKELGDQYWNDEIEQFDPPLTEKGEEQSYRLKEYFKAIDVKKIYVSDCIRTIETIKPIAIEKNIAPERISLLNEINTGLFSRMNNEERKEQYYNEWKSLNIEKKDFTYPNGESGKEVLDRVKTIFEMLKERNENTLIATHEGWVKIAICHLLNLDPGERFHFHVDMGGILEADYNAEIDYWKILRMNYLV